MMMNDEKRMKLIEKLEERKRNWPKLSVPLRDVLDIDCDEMVNFHLLSAADREDAAKRAVERKKETFSCLPPHVAKVLTEAPEFMRETEQIELLAESMHEVDGTRAFATGAALAKCVTQADASALWTQFERAEKQLGPHPEPLTSQQRGYFLDKLADASSIASGDELLMLLPRLLVVDLVIGAAKERKELLAEIAKLRLALPAGA